MIDSFSQNINSTTQYVIICLAQRLRKLGFLALKSLDCSVEFLTKILY
jgi:hypothetical protein